MIPPDLLATARALGVRVELDARGLVVRPAGAIPPELRPLFTEHKAAITELLRREAAPTNNIDFGPPVVVSEPRSRLHPLVDGPEALASLASVITSAEGPIALGLATSGPDPLLHRAQLLALGLRDGIRIVDLTATGGLGPLADHLRRAEIVGHGLQCPLAFLRHHFDVTPVVKADAEIQSKLLGGGANLKSDAHTLDALAMTQLGLRLPAAPSPGDLAQHPRVAAVVLAARTVVIPALVDRLGRESAAMKLNIANFLESSVLPGVAATSLWGVGLDSDRLRTVIAEREAAQAGHEKTLRAALGDVNLDDDNAVLGALQRYGLPVDKTGKDALTPFLGDPVAQALVSYRRLNAFTQDLGPKLLTSAGQYLDGRVRPMIDPLGTATGRFTYSAPNLQGVEKGDAVRSCIVPAPGYVFVVGDYAAIDLRVLADRVNVGPMIRAFEAGADLHRVTASILAGKVLAEVTEEERSRAKEVNFGIVYGMGAESLAHRLFVRFGTPVSVADAQRMLDAYRLRHPEVEEWQERTRRDNSPDLRTASGRIVRFYGNEYARRLNAGIQGTAADGYKLALIRLHNSLPQYGARVVHMVHDEIVVEAPREHAAAVAACLRGNMIDGMKFFVKKVPIVVEVDVRETWAKRSKIDMVGAR